MKSSKKKMIIIIVIALVITAGLYALSWIPQKIDAVYNGELHNFQSVKTQDTMHIEGKLFTPWFTEAFFRGKLYFENTSELHFELCSTKTSRIYKTADDTAVVLIGADGGLTLEKNETGYGYTHSGEADDKPPRFAEITFSAQKNVWKIIEADFSCYEDNAADSLPQRYSFTVK